ncbi:BAH_G0023770.mRNA.1.CDS.1 [Saccharomyces cerevisiae]|nr:SX2_G0055690.mRNA.1.CDS.1 [Saccharomyces cerevisiae]CAI4533433.1 BAH_G0023770.mRNA.1.CDS.1 [Saccharomyces cerevisiae]CAI4534983.1 BAG_1a_G0023900.mRNA.1.CDS.1 [Saccharomyces cerevisiae]CAI7159011.1 BAG_1a_G0023900.mRNA.1.CDS.1 [Saccharomyces cerevisiae]CAI7160175.1 BAH_G0023770.mRNA.1.CDS.1 [Saccharomyces cerevisiae]
MEDIEKIKPYVRSFSKALDELKPEIEKLTSKSLDEQLLLLSDERAKLELINRYAYVLSSLMFANMKVLGVKDMTPILGELKRVKSYMDKAKQYDNRITKSNEKSQAEQEKAKNIISNVLDGNKNQFEPSISRSNFQGKHTKFENDELAESTTTKIIDSTDHIRKASSKKSKRLDKVGKKKGGKK